MEIHGPDLFGKAQGVSSPSISGRAVACRRLLLCHIVGPNYDPVCIRPARSRYLIGPNKDRDTFGLLKARDLIHTIMGRGSFRAAAGP